MVFVGSTGAPPGHCGRDLSATPPAWPYVTVDTTPVVAEKPFISINAAGKYFLNIPHVRRDAVGPQLGPGGMIRVGFEQVYVARSDVDTSATINEKLRAGLHVVLSPGIYRLSGALEVVASGQVLLGLGLATLIPLGRDPAVTVASNLDGVRVAGILLEAGPGPTSALLRWGQDAYAGDPADPGVLSDVFARVGGPSRPYEPQVDAMIVINTGHVIGDNLWLWRADHVDGGGLVSGGANPCKVGLVVNGDHVTMYGLAVEHTLQDGVQWNGEAGATYFFQFEFPYDVDQSFGDAGYVAYRVNPSVRKHIGQGVGAYHYFRDYPVVLQTAISTPKVVQDSFVSPLSICLKGLGRVKHVINDEGCPTSTAPGEHDSWWCGHSGCPDGGSTTTTNGGHTTTNGGHTTATTTTATENDQGLRCWKVLWWKVHCKKEEHSAPTSVTTSTTSVTTSKSTTPPTEMSVTTTSAKLSHAEAAKPAASAFSCRVGDAVLCPGGRVFCAGNQCCPPEGPQSSACPSAEANFTGCSQPKILDCTRPAYTVIYS